MTTHLQPWHQRAIVTFAAAGTGFIMLGIVLEIIDSAITLLTPRITYYGTIILALGSVTIHCFLRVKPIRWLAKGNQLIRLSGLGRSTWWGISGAILLLWVPRLISIAPTKNSEPIMELYRVDSATTGVPSGIGGAPDEANVTTQPAERANAPLLFAYTEYEEGVMTGDAGKVSLLSLGRWESYAGVVIDHHVWLANKRMLHREPQDPGGLYRTPPDPPCEFASAMRQSNPALLPGYLAFIIQNAGGETSPDITVKAVSIQTNIVPAPIASDSLIVSRLEYSPGATSRSMIPTSGTVYLDPSRSDHPVIPFNTVDEETGLRLPFRKRLKPGEEGFWAIRVDAPVRTSFHLRMELRVEYFVVEENRSVTYTAIFPDVYDKPVARPSFDQIAGVCNTHDWWEGRNAISPEKVWGESWRAPRPR